MAKELQDHFIILDKIKDDKRIFSVLNLGEAKNHVIDIL